jgi:membrane protease YdiL (CAAX protease family)
MNYKFILSSIVTVLALSIFYYLDKINLLAVAVILTYLTTILVFYSTQNRFLKVIGFIIVTMISIGLILHLIPGFNNIVMYKEIILSPKSLPFSLWFNFDKIFCLLLLVGYPYPTLSIEERKAIISKVLLIFSLAFMVLMVIAQFDGYIRFSPKIPTILFTWMVINFIVVATEEAFFRHFLQKSFMKCFSKFDYGNFYAITLVAILFGAGHYWGGLTYILFSFVAGLFYGVAVYATQRIEASIAVHFLINLTHIIFFTYPALDTIRFS